MRPDQMPAAEHTAATARRKGMQSDLLAPVELRLITSPDAPAEARAAVVGWIAGRASETLLADAELVVGELVANSVRHADAPADAVITVRVEARTDALRLEVVDRGTSGSIVRRAPDLEYGGGFGLNLVESLSRRWGVDRNGGTSVWAELAVGQAAADL